MIRSGAVLSKDRKDRYVLWRIWGPSPKRLVVIGLNPSTADETTDDATIRRCIGFAKREHCGGLYMLNLFSYRSTDPDNLNDPVAQKSRRMRENEKHILLNTTGVDRVIVAAWGTHWMAARRGDEVMQIVGRHRPVYCFGLSTYGFPLHPLRLAKTTPLVEYA